MELSESTAAAAVRALKNTFAEYAQISPRMPRELFEGIMSEENCAELFEKVVFNVVLKVEDKQALLETNGLLRRVKMLISMLESEIEIIETEIDIQEQVKEQVDKNQREYYLREQLRAIYKQLGEGDNPQEEADGYIEKIRALNLSDEITEKLIGEAQKLVKMSYSSQEAGVIRGYLDTVLELPWNVKTKDKLDIEKVQKQHRQGSLRSEKGQGAYHRNYLRTCARSRCQGTDHLPLRPSRSRQDLYRQVHR